MALTIEREATFADRATALRLLDSDIHNDLLSREGIIIACRREKEKSIEDHQSDRYGGVASTSKPDPRRAPVA
jgi:hypothetical protein